MYGNEVIALNCWMHPLLSVRSFSPFSSYSGQCSRHRSIHHTPGVLQFRSHLDPRSCRPHCFCSLHLRRRDGLSTSSWLRDLTLQGLQVRSSGKCKMVTLICFLNYYYYHHCYYYFYHAFPIRPKTLTVNENQNYINTYNKKNSLTTTNCKKDVF